MKRPRNGDKINDVVRYNGKWRRVKDLKILVDDLDQTEDVFCDLKIDKVTKEMVDKINADKLRSMNNE